MDFQDEDCRLNSSGSKEIPVAGCNEHGDKYSACVK
jgi:hypothetical protein